MSDARVEPMLGDDNEVPPHISGAALAADMAGLDLEQFGPLPAPILMSADTVRGTTEWCLMMVPHAARDARARACFDALPEAAVVRRELRARVARSPLCEMLSAYSMEDFEIMDVGDTPDAREMHVFRRVALHSASALP